MANHAGYAAVVVVQRSVLEAVLRIYHSAGVLPSQVKRSFPVSGGILTLDLFLDLPRLVLEDRPDTRVGLALRFVGSAHFKLGATSEATTVVLTTTVAANLALRATNRGVQAGIDLSAATIDALDVRVDVGAPALSKVVEDALRRPETRGVLTLFLNTVGVQQASLTPPLLTQVSAIFGDTPVDLKLATIRPLAGAIALAVDLAGVTKGDRAKLADFSLGAPIAVSTHAGVILHLFNLSKPALMARRGDVSLTSASLSLGTGVLHIAGGATLHTPWYLPDGAADFSADAAFRVGTDRLFVDLTNVDVDIPVWLQVLGFLVGAVGLGAICPPAALAWPAVFPVLSAVLDDFAEGLAESTAERALRSARLFTFTLPETSTPTCSLRIDAIQVSPDGVDSRVTFTARLDLSDTTVDAPHRVMVADTSPIPVKLTVGKGLVHPADPTIRVRWEVRARPSNTVVMVKEAKLDDLTLMIPRTGANSNLREFLVRCQVVRPMGQSADEVVYATERRIYVLDRLDPGKGPYVRWSHWVYIPSSSEAKGSTRAYLGAGSKERHSKIHRTATPGRCKMADRFSEHVDPFSKKYHQKPVEYLQALPFPIGEIKAHRAMLCDYCFFGGPDKTEPLPL